VKRVVLIALLLTACKQGKGDRCQVMADCQDGLVCNSSTMTCQDTTGGQIDATVIDAPPVDAKVIDAKPIDAPHD